MNCFASSMPDKRGKFGRFAARLPCGDYRRLGGEKGNNLFSPASSIIFIFPKAVGVAMTVPAVSVPSFSKMLALGPRRESIDASITKPSAGFLGRP